jgi:hypothetical protein
MRTMIFPAMFLIATAAACGGEDEPDVDAEGCEHLQEGPYAEVSASATRNGTAPPPAVAADHRAYTVTLPLAAIGYVSFAAAEATDYIVFLDLPAAFAVLDATGARVTLEASATSSPACAAIRGKHTFALPVGTAYFELGPNMGMLNLVIEEAAGHEH